MAASSAVADSLLNITDVGSLTANSNAQVVSADGSVAGGHSADQSFRWTSEDGMHGLGTLPGAENPFNATAMSADGNAVIGTSDSYDAASGMSIRKIVLWTSGGGLLNLGEPPSASQGHNEWDMNASPQISGNGQVVVAMRQGSDGQRIWRWTSGTNWVDLNPPPGGTTQWDTGVLRMSNDGSFLIANSQDSRAWRWFDGEGWTEISSIWALDEGGEAWATDISADGSVVVGITAFDMGGHVFRWTDEFGMDDLGQPLGGLPGDNLFVSGDGLVIAGTAEGYFGYEHFVTRAFRWESGGGGDTEDAGGWEALGTLSEDESSKATGLSFDGSVVVGQSFTEDLDTQISLVNHAFRWTSADGISGLGELPDGATDSGANAVNGDGSVVVGLMARLVQSDQLVEVRAFRWTEANGVEGLGALASPTFPNDISGDGAAVVGQAIFGDLLHQHHQQDSESGSHAFRWNFADGIADLGLAPGETDARAEFTNGDGSVVVGTTQSRDESTGRRSTQAFRWTSEGLDHLGTLSGDTDSYISSDENHPGPDDESGGGKCVSEDGSVVVGTSENIDAGNGDFISSRAFIWYSGEGMYSLGALDEGQDSYATAVSGDGFTVVGGSAGSDDNNHFIHRAFRWTDEDGMQNLGLLPGTENAVAFFTSFDGSVVVGSCFNTDPNSGNRKEFQAFRWTDSEGMVSLGTLPEDSGQDSYWPVSISSDGSVVLGMRHHPGIGGGTRTAFLWSVDHGMIALPAALQHIHAFSLSGDGTLVAGATNSGSSRAACIWNESFGLVDLRVYLVAFGLNMDSWNLLECGVSRDGSTIVGTHEIDGRTSTFVVTGFHTLPTNVVAWGYNAYGQTSLPVTLGECKAISGGGDYSMALQDNGTVVVWGRNNLGQCNVPFDLGACKAIAAGSYHCVALKEDGTVVCWGYNGNGQCTVPADLGPCKAIAGGRYHTVALKVDGTVVAWGAGTTDTGAFGQNGQSMVPATLGACKAIAAGGFHSMAIREDGTVVAWGTGYLSGGHSAVPAELGACKAIAAGFDHSLAILDDGTVVAWGANNVGQSNVPPALGPCTSIASGSSSFSVAIRVDGSVAAWGQNDFGEGAVPAGLGSCEAVATGFFHTLAIRTPSILPPPTDVAASDGTSTDQVSVTWTGIAGADSYSIFRASDGPATQIGTSLTTDYSDSSAVPGTLYTYTVKTIKGALASMESISDTGYRNLTAPTDVAASDGTSTTEVTVTWTGSTGAVSYKVYRSTGGTPTHIGDSGTTTYHDSSAVAGTLYTYGVKAVGAVGQSDPSATDTGFMNLVAPTNVAASDGTSTSEVTVTWTAAPCAVSYQVYRSTGGSPAQIGTSLTTSYSDTFAVPGTLYTYSVKAVGNVGSSVASAADTGYRNVSAPADFAASDGTSTSEVTLTWTAATGAASYQVFRSTGGAPVQIGTALTATYGDASADPGTLYTYSVTSVGASGVSVLSTSNTGYRNLLAPTGVAASDGTRTSGVTVNWTAAVGAIGYDIFRASDGSPTQIGSASSTTYDDTSAVAGTLYTYTVKAHGANGMSLASGADTGWRHVLAPTSVLASAGTSTAEVALTWTASTGATSYQIFRDGGESPVGTSSSASYHDTAASIGLTASYTVRAVYTISSMDHYSDLSAPGATGWRAPAAPSFVEASDGTSTAKVSVDWNEVTGATGYEVSRNGVIIRTPDVQTTAAFDDVVTAGLSFTYVIRAHAPAGYGPASAAETGFRNISPPTGVAATDGNFTDRVDITWNAATDAVGYQIFRSGTSGAIGATTSALTFSDTTGGIGTTYSYWVKSVSLAGAGSNPVIPSSSSLINSGYRKVAAPTGVDASDGLGSKVTVTWTTVPGATGYYIYRTSGVTTALAGTVTGNAVGTYDDVTATYGTLFTYTVKALAPAGLSDPSAGNAGYRMAAPIGVQASDGSFTNMVFVNWTAPTNATGYQILRRLNPADAPTTIATIVGGAVLSGGDLTADPNTVYLYSVRANSAAGYGPESPTDSGYRGMPAPTAVAASDGEYEDSIRVQWSPIPGVTGYQILRNGVSIGTVAGGSSTPFYVDGDTGAVAPVTTYTYTVKSLYGASGSSLASLGNTGWRGPAPKNVVASDGQYSNHVDILWTKMTGVSTYRVFRNGVQISGKLTGSGNTLLMQDTTAQPNVIYTYTVRAVLALGLGPASLGDSGSLMGSISTLTGGDAGDSSGDAGKHGKGSRASHGGGGAAGDETKDVTKDAETVESADQLDESSMVCDEIFLRISDRIATAQNELDTAISTNDDAGSAEGEALSAAMSVKTFDRAEATRLIADLVEQLSLDADQNGVLDFCQRAGGDVDLNGAVDDFDMVAFVTAMESGDLRVGDLNGDGEIDGADLGMLLLAFPEVDHGDADTVLDSKVNGAE